MRVCLRCGLEMEYCHKEMSGEHKYWWECPNKHIEDFR